jgi:hypothetical protein
MMNGGDLSELAKILCHSNINMTECYGLLTTACRSACILSEFVVHEHVHTLRVFVHNAFV